MGRSKPVGWPELADFREIWFDQAGAKAHPPIFVGDAFRTSRAVRSPMATARVRSLAAAPVGRRRRDFADARPRVRADPAHRALGRGRTDRQFNLSRPDLSHRTDGRPDRSPQPDRQQRYRGERCHSAQPNRSLPFHSIVRRRPVTPRSVDDGASLLGRDLAVHRDLRLRANNRGCVARDFNHNSVTIASEQRQVSVLGARESQPGPKSRSSKWQFCHVSCRAGPSFRTDALTCTAVCRPIPIGV